MSESHSEIMMKIKNKTYSKCIKYH